MTVHRLAHAFVGARLRAMLWSVSAFRVKSFQSKSFQSKGFRLPAAAELLLFCLSKREVIKRKRPPAWRLPDIGQPLLRCLNSGIHALAMSGKSVSRGRAFRAGIVPARKGESIHGLARCAACRPRLTAAQGTPGRAAGHRGPHSVMKRKSNSHSKTTFRCGFAAAFDLVLLKSARRMRAALPGSPLQRRAGEGKPAGWPAGMPASFSPAQATAWMPEWRQRRERLPDVLSKNPVARTRTLRAGCPQGAEAGWPFSLVTFSLATQRESDSVAEGDRPLLILNATGARASRTSALLQLQARLLSGAAAAKHAIGARA